MKVALVAVTQICNGFFFFSSRRRHTILVSDWSSDVCSSDLPCYQLVFDDLKRGKLDIAFLRREQQADLEYQLVAREPLVVILPSDHPLAERDAIDRKSVV